MPHAEPVAAVPTDAALIAAWQGGDEQAAAQLVRRHARALARFLAGAEQAITAAGDPVERLQDFIRHHVTFFAANLAEMKVLSHEATSLRGERQRKVNAIKRRYVDLLERLLREVAPEEPRAERSAAAYALFGMMNWIYNWYDPAGEIDPDRLAGLIARIFVGGFAEARSTVQGG